MDKPPLTMKMSLQDVGRIIQAGMGPRFFDTIDDNHEQQLLTTFRKQIDEGDVMCISTLEALETLQLKQLYYIQQLKRANILLSNCNVMPPAKLVLTFSDVKGSYQYVITEGNIYTVSDDGHFEVNNDMMQKVVIDEEAE